jgi:hypothetical protein
MAIVNALGLSPTTALKQIVSTINVFRYMPSLSVFTYTADMMTNPSEYKTIINKIKNTDYIKNRANAFDITLVEAMESNKPTARLITEIAMTPISKMDITPFLLSGPIYVKYLMDNKGLTMDQAIDTMIQDYNETQQSGLRVSASENVRKQSSLGRIVRAFTSAQRQMNADMYVTGVRAINNGTKENWTEFAKSVTTFTMVNSIILVTVSNVFSGLVNKALGEEDEDKELVDLFSEFVRTMPFTSYTEIVSAPIELIFDILGFDSYDSNTIIYSTFREFTKSIKRLLKNGLDDPKFFEDTSNAVSMLTMLSPLKTPIPLKRPAKTIDKYRENN